MARQVVTLRLHEAVDTFLRLRGLPVDSYVIFGQAARWLRGYEPVLGVVSIYVPGLPCDERTDLYGFIIEASTWRKDLDAKFSVRVSLHGLSVEP